MPMGIVSDKDFDAELGNSSRIPRPVDNPNSRIVNIPSRGRKEGDNNVPDSLRKVIGETAQLNGRGDALELAKNFGVSPSSVSAYSNGATSTSSYNERTGIGNHINNAKERIAKKARAKMLRALHHITDDNLAGTKPRELAGIAKDMSVIVKNMEPDNPNPLGPTGGPTFIIMAPTIKSEKEYEVIQAKDIY